MIQRASTSIAIACIVSAVCVFGACAAGNVNPAGDVPPPIDGGAPDTGAPVRAVGAAAADSLVPPGFGTLRQDEVTISIRSDALLIKVTPLSESVIRMLAPDTYARLNALRESRTADASRATMRRPEMFLVSFFSYQPDVAFQPEGLQVIYQSRLLRPAAVIPLTTGWGQQRLDQQSTQNAIYAFDEEMDFRQVFSVRYGTSESDGWQQVMTRLENERGRILARVR